MLSNNYEKLEIFRCLKELNSYLSCPESTKLQLFYLSRYKDIKNNILRVTNGTLRIKKPLILETFFLFGLNVILL